MKGSGATLYWADNLSDLRSLVDSNVPANAMAVLQGYWAIR
jgi:hypothetical protein